MYNTTKQLTPTFMIKSRKLEGILLLSQREYLADKV